jgi:glutamate-1-semialdehyde 2,1-aminomutase/spore coat polysaccharide biosynthesis protein SpsF
MTTAVIVQARMGSTRLPGKVMLDLAGQSVLAHVLQRCRSIPGADVVVCAVPDTKESAPLEEVARQCDAWLARGSETDVLDRYLHAAETVGATVVMRVTSDCPLIDPKICGDVLALRVRENVDYACNNLPRTFPHGLDCEAMTMEALMEAAAKASQAYDREHVTPWLRRAPHLTRANLACDDSSVARHRWTLDYPADLAFLRAVLAALPRDGRVGHGEILDFLAARPDLVAINAECHQPAGATPYEGRSA